MTLSLHYILRNSPPFQHRFRTSINAGRPARALFEPMDFGIWPHGVVHEAPFPSFNLTSAKARRYFQKRQSKFF